MMPVARLRQLARQSPAQVLFSAAGTDLDAAGLNDAASRLAAQLCASGVTTGDNVALYLPRGLQGVQAVYGILMAGACYVPLSAQFPAERNRFIVQQADCQQLVVAGAAPPWLEDAAVTVINIESLPAAPLHELPAGQPATANAAILYTSGSTGQPRGVVISLRAIAAFWSWCVSSFGLGRDDRIASLAPFHFDLSLFDLFAAPAAGALTCFIPDELKLAPAGLVAWLGRMAITSWYTVPSMLGLLTLKGGLDQQPMPRLRQVLYAGEVFPTPRLQRFCALLPGVEVFNLFGPTETNVCLYWRVDRTRLQGTQPLPVGAPACAAELMIDAGQGELLMKGPCLMSGYWQDGRAVPAVDAGGWFHSGDRVSLNDHDEYLFHGRLDRMVKSAGYRIEPAEIEQVLTAAPGVVQAAVVGIPDAISGTRIAAAVAVAGADRAALQRHAVSQLASWMRPSFYLLLERLPCLPNGKIDYQGLCHIIKGELSA